MSLKRNYSKKLSKTIALAVMAMSVAGFASVASAEEPVDTIFGSSATITGQYTAASETAQIPNPIDKEELLDVVKATITATSDLTVNSATALNGDKFYNTTVDMANNALSVHGNDNGIVVGVDASDYSNIKPTNLTLKDIKSLDLIKETTERELRLRAAGDMTSISKNVGIGAYSVINNVIGWGGEYAPTYAAVADIATTGDVNVKNYAVGLAVASSGINKDLDDRVSGININAGGDINLVGNGQSAGGKGIYATGKELNSFPNKYTSEDVKKFYEEANKAEINVVSNGKISVTDFETAVAAHNGASVNLKAKGDIILDSTGQYGIWSQGFNRSSDYRTGGNIELTSEEGKITIKGAMFGIYNENNGKLNINGKSEIISDGYGIYSINASSGSINVNGDTKIISLSDGINVVQLGALNINGDIEIESNKKGIYLYKSNMDVKGDLTVNNADNGIVVNSESKLILEGDINSKNVGIAVNGNHGNIALKGNINIQAKEKGLSFEAMNFTYDKGSVNIIAPTAVCAKGQIEEKILSAKELSWDDKWASDKEGFKEYCSESSDIGDNGDGAFENVLSVYGLTFDEYYAACVEEQTLYPAIGAWNGMDYTMQDDHSDGCVIFAVEEKEIVVNSWNTATLDLANAKGESIIKGDLVAEDGGNINILNAKNLTFEGKTVLAEIEGNSEINLDLSEGSVWTVTGDSQLTKLSGTDGVIKPGEFTVTTKAAAEGTSVNVVGVGDLNAIANKIFYTNFVNGENNLSAKAVIESEAARESAEMLFKEDNGQGYIDENKATDTEIFGEYNESINKNTNVTVTETGTWTPTGENSVAGLKGEAGSAINMSNADSLKIDSYSGETTMLYGHEESDPTQIIGGDVTVGTAETGSKITMSTDNKGINTLDKGQVESVLNSMANKLTYEGAAEGENNLTGKLQIAEGLTASSAAVKAGDIEFDKDGKGSLKAGSVDYGAEETAVMGAMKGALLSSALMVRAESNDLLKRMGDVRLAEEDRGLWAKYYGGKYEMDKANAHVSYKAYQLGYDTKAGKNWTVGGAVSYNEGKDGKTELKNTAVGVYGTWADDKGQYIDLITKIGWLKNDFDVKAAGYQIADTMKTTGMSMSAEYGKRFENKAGSFLEPNAELTFGHLNGKKVNANVVGGGTTLGVDQDAFNSLVGRLGLRIGHKTAKSSVYAKVALAHEFAGDFDVTFSAPSEPTKKVSVDLKDTWGEFQIGGTTKVGKAGLLYANYQRSFAGDVKEKYRVDAGLRWSF